VARHRLAGVLASTAIAAAMTCAAGRAHAQASAQSFTPSQPPSQAQAAPRDSQAQSRDLSVPSLFEPHFDDRDGRPQRFRRPGAPASVAQVSSGAGSTGFDATHSRAKRKAKEEARKRAQAQAENLPPIVQAGPDRTVAPVFQKEESQAAARRRATNSAPVPLDATGAVAARPLRRRVVEDDPFAPVGNYWGTFLAKPALEVSTGYNSNPGQRLNGNGSWFEKVAPELVLRSNWSQHELNADLRGSYTWYNQLENFSKPDVNLRANGRIDVSRQTKIDLDGRFIFAADNPGDPNLPTDIKKPPFYTVAGGVVGIRQAFNRLEFSLKGAIDSTQYQDGTTNNGQTVSFADRNYNQYGVKIRASYDWLPGVIPFVEYGADDRKHDLAADVNGVNRDSSGQSVRVGSTFLLTGYLTGEIAVGYLERSYVDPTLLPVHGTLLDASLTYYATPLTTLKLDMKTTVDESTLGNVSGQFSHLYAAQIDHAFRRWLIGSVRFGYTNVTYVGSPRDDNYFSFSTALTYKLTREWWLKGEYRREWLNSNAPGADYLTNIFLVGLRLQR
jgi:hypothetical protein